MSVSLIADKAASQEAGIALAEGAANLFSECLIPKKEEVEKNTRHRPAPEIDILKFLENNQGKKLAVEILKPFFARLAQVGITLAPQAKTGNQINEKLEESALGLESFEDEVEIKSRPDVVQQIKRLAQLGGEEGDQSFGGYSQEEILSLLSEYAAVFSEYVSSQSPELADKLKDLREKIKEKGISEAKLQSLEAGLSEGRRPDLTEMVKEALVLQLLGSHSKIERAIYGRGIADLLKNLDPHEAKEVLEKAQFKAKQELQNFALEELENVLIKKTYLQDHSFSDAFKLLKVADKIGLDYGTWLEKVWPQKKEDHGLYFLDVPHSTTGLVVDTSTDGSHNRRQRHGFEYEKEDEKEILINRLRALYLQRALKGNAFTYLSTEFKIRKLKNGLFKLGISTKDLDEKIQHEAEVVAKIKTIEMLKEALIERATFYELAGPAYQLVERKIKGLLKNAERLELPISAEEFNLMRDQANQRVFELSKIELQEVRTKRGIKDLAKLEKKEKLLLRLLTRLKEESKIEDSIPGNC